MWKSKDNIISRIVTETIKNYLRRKYMVNEQKNNGVIVYRGMDKEHSTNQNVWVTDSEEYALYWAKQEYNKNGIVSRYFLPNDVISDLCNSNAFEEIMNEYDAWQEIPDDSPVWEEGEDAEHDLMHDLCFPSKKQIAILKGEGYKGLIFNYTDECYSILIFDGRNLKII